MRALVVYCHPRENSFTAAVRDRVLAGLSEVDAEVRMIDLYAEGFDPVLSAEGLVQYQDEVLNRQGIETHLEALAWCNALIFVYPTWWYGLPAMLKGWLDRVLVPGAAFVMPKAEGETIGPGLTHITRLGVFTTCGASWWLTRFIGAPGRRTLLRGIGVLCAPGRRSVFAAHYLMDSATQPQLEGHLRKVDRQMRRLCVGLPVRRTDPARAEEIRV